MDKNNVVQFPLTDEQVDYIAEEMDKAIEGTPLEDIAKFPSNNDQMDRNPDEIEEGESVKAMVTVDPNTGEHRVDSYVEDVEEESFEDMVNRIENSEMSIEHTPITETEIIDYMINNKDSNMIMNDVFSDVDLKPESIRKLLEIVNRKLNKEDFKVYKELPDEVKDMILKYMSKGGIPIMDHRGKEFRNMLAEELIQEFITNISMDKIKQDFNKELEDIFTKGGSEIADTVVGYTEERNKSYREYAEKMEDPEKKEKMLAILDKIDEAYNLTELKEFSKKCRIKNIELEKPQARAFDNFLRKYETSTYNMYDINMGIPILFRNLNAVYEEETFTEDDVVAFFICFCKQCVNMSPEVVTEHAYMYYVIYNVILVEINKGKSSDVSKTFLANVREIILNLRERNKCIH